MNDDQETLVSELNLLHERICKAIGDPKRLLILYALRDTPRYVVELADTLELPQPTVSRHLAALFRSGLVSKERRGQAVYYALRDPRILDAIDLMRAVMREDTARMAALTEPKAVSPDKN